MFFRRKEFWKFFFLGLLVCLSTLALSIYWNRLMGFMLGRVVTYDAQPTALKFINNLIAYSPIIYSLCILIWGLRTRRFLAIFSSVLGAIVVPYAIFISYIFLAPAAQDYASRIEFNSESWKQGDMDNSGIRLKMVDSLMQKYSLKGMSRAEIKKLLGVPASTSYFTQYDYVYWLGPERGFISIDSEWLVIKFENETVSDIRILRD